MGKLAWNWRNIPSLSSRRDALRWQRREEAGIADHLWSIEKIVALEHEEPHKMTEKQWTTEVVAAIQQSGWRIFAAGCTAESFVCFAHLNKGEENRGVTLSHRTFPTPASRQAEIRRQLSS